MYPGPAGSAAEVPRPVSRLLGLRCGCSRTAGPVVEAPRLDVYAPGLAVEASRLGACAWRLPGCLAFFFV